MAELQQVQCESCGAPCVWMKTRNDKNILVDVDSLDPDDDDLTIFDRQRHTTHFVTCPNADEHRRDNPKPKAVWRFVRIALADGKTVDIAIAGDRVRVRPAYGGKHKTIAVKLTDAPLEKAPVVTLPE